VGRVVELINPCLRHHPPNPLWKRRR
jgi:hypothetical protein